MRGQRKQKKNGSRVGELDEYMRAVRKADREAELERNGGRWIAKDRPHKNKKKYDRKRDRRIDFLRSLSFNYVIKVYFKFVLVLR